MQLSSRRVAASLLTVSLVSGACGRNENTTTTDSAAGAVAPRTPAPTAGGATGAASVANVSLGKRLGSDGRVTDSTSTFASRDTIYLTVETAGATPASMLVARWKFQDGQVVDSTSQQVASTSTGANAVTEFHVANPSGWPAGQYTVDVFLDGRSVATRTFRVNR